MAKYPNICYQCFGSVNGRCDILKKPYKGLGECPFFKPTWEVDREEIEKELGSYHIARLESD